MTQAGTLDLAAEVAGDRVGVVLGDDQDQADPHVEDAEHLGVGDAAEPLEPGEDRRARPTSRVRARMAQPSGRIRGGLSIRPPPVMWAMPWTIRLTR